MNLNKNAGIWITGASSGIGKAATIELVNSGVKVFASAKRIEELDKLKSELKNKSRYLKIFRCDVESRFEVEQTVRKITSIYKIDCLVNNAGITSFKKVEDCSLDEIEQIIRTNLFGAIYAIKSILPFMIKNKGGTIINILSVVTKKVFTNSSAYAASKMGLLGFTNSLREEVRKSNIRIINIIPGATKTKMWPEKIRNKNSGRMMKPENIASVIKWAYFQNDNMVPEEILLRPYLGDL
jgi:3-oxoacyl-[acyl-carrier protein] reductase